jgi:hypothetical protein
LETSGALDVARQYALDYEGVKLVVDLNDG